MITVKPLLSALCLTLCCPLLLAQHEAGQAHDAHADNAALPQLVYTVAESTGNAQSPINIQSRTTEPAHHQIALHYQSSGEHITNLGHTIQADFEPGSSMEYDGLTYELKQLHFHTPSEHLIDGITYPMEMHMVHTQAGNPGKYLVIGMLFREGELNEFLQEILRKAPLQAGDRVDDVMQLDVNDLLASVEGYYHYEGSLTTPPYSETVTWLVMQAAQQASAAQLELLNKLEGNNARHIQTLHARHIEAE